MICNECYNVSEVDGEYYTECEQFGRCTFGDKVIECPEEQLDIFKMRTFNIGYIGAGDPVEYETQFDIKDGSFAEMFEELITLFQNFVKESGYTSAQNIRIEEVGD